MVGRTWRAGGLALAALETGTHVNLAQFFWIHSAASSGQRGHTRCRRRSRFPPSNERSSHDSTDPSSLPLGVRKRKCGVSFKGGVGERALAR